MNGKIVITGAAGFLGGRMTKYFSKKEITLQVIATSRRTTRTTEFEKNGAQFTAGDLTNKAFCKTLTKEVKVVIHCAALSSPYGTYSNFYMSNYIATKNLLEASIENGVQKFIFISTPSIYFNFCDRYDVKESDPLPNKMVNSYAATKLMAEELVLAHNAKEIQTIALRPRAIIGAEDTVIFPRVLEAYKQGKLKIVGSGRNICDLTCASNLIEAVVCCINAHPTAYGEAYNITDGIPIPFWGAMRYTLEALQLTPPTKKAPRRLALFVASIVEGKAKLFRQKKEPAITKYGIGILADNFTLDITKAKTRLGYIPKMTTYEGIDEFIAWHKTKK